jgi:hypothetical protein
MEKRSARAVWPALGLAFVLMGGPVRAQETVNYASLSGIVRDPSGAVVPGAHVVARQTQTNITADATSDQEGRFRFPYLRVGPYEVIVSLDGFRDATRSVTLTVGSAFEMPFSLALASIDAAVSVTAEAPVLDVVRSQIAGAVSQTEMRDLALNGRNFLDVALLVPGVSPTNIGSTQLFAETSAVPGQGLSVSSQRNFSNNFLVDGLSANDDAAGLSGMPYVVDAIDQFQVVTSGGQAELGRALGGYVSVVTKSGTNTAHGDVYGYFRDDRFNGPNALSGRKLPMDQQQYGLGIGGPILRNRTFFFGNVERRQLHQTGLVTVSQENVAAINARLASAGYPGAPVVTGLYPNPVDSTHVLGKIDHQINGRDQVSVRYSQYDAQSSHARGAGGTAFPSAASGLDNRDQSLAVGNTLTLSRNTVNETRAQLAYGDLSALPEDPIGPAVSIAGIASFGTLSSSPQGRVNTLLEVVNNLSHQRGAHALRAGADLLVNWNRITFPRSVRGAYTFSTLQNFLSGTYNNAGFTQTFGPTDVSQTSPNLGVYVQDEWKAHPDVTVNAGLRYDLQWLDTIHTDTNNLSPRLGVAWTPFGSLTTVMRGSAGLYFDRVPLRALANALLSANNTTDPGQLRQSNIVLSPGQAGAPSFPGILSAPIPSVTLVNFTTMDRDLQTAYSRQGSVEVERQLGGRASYSAAYQYVRGIHLLMSVNQNVSTCVATGSNNGCRPNPSYGNNSRYSSVGASNYHGLHLSFVQRPAAWGYVRVSYTLSKSMNNVGEAFFNSPIDPFDLSKDWGRSDDDQRHRLVVSGALRTPTSAAESLMDLLTHGFQWSATLQTYSALPLNITSGLTTVQGTAGRPVVDGSFIPRNAGVGNDFLIVNTRLSRSFPLGRARIQAIVEGFNVTNRVNPLTRIGNFGAAAYPSNPSATFNQLTSVGEPRAFQFGVRVEF